MDSYHRVIAMSLTSGSNATTMVAGTGTAGASSTTLHFPNGIVVDINFNLYVADWGNNRIQKFMHNQLNATTVAGTGAPGTIALIGPTGVMVDANEYLFIADYGNNRIVGSGPYGFRCVIGCSGSGGSSPSQLYEPQNLGFDSYGNIYVADSGNNRIQMFLLTNNSCTTSG
jgi:sugar lactone lactonase YvrE